MVFCCVVPEVIADTSLPSDMPVKRRGEEGKVLLEVNRNFPWDYLLHRTKPFQVDLHFPSPGVTHWVGHKKYLQATDVRRVLSSFREGWWLPLQPLVPVRRPSLQFIKSSSPCQAKFAKNQNNRLLETNNFCMVQKVNIIDSRRACRQLKSSRR